MDRWKRLVATMVVAMCGAFSVGHYVGASSAAGELSDCRAAVVAALDAERSAVGASERFVEYAGRCV